VEEAACGYVWSVRSCITRGFSCAAMLCLFAGISSLVTGYGSLPVSRPFSVISNLSKKPGQFFGTGSDPYFAKLKFKVYYHP
jgi:hypothetical protein